MFSFNGDLETPENQDSTNLWPDFRVVQIRISWRSLNQGTLLHELFYENSIYDAHLWNYSSQTSKILNLKSHKITLLNQRAELTNVRVKSVKEHILVFNEGNFAPCPIREQINKYFRHWLLK